MIYDLNKDIDRAKFEAYNKRLLEGRKRCETKEIKDTRSSRQNSALHLFFVFISNELNELGLEYQYTGISGKTFELRYTHGLVKDFIWRPIQIAMFDIKSTKKLNTSQMNDIIDVLIKFFGEQGVVLKFPSIESLIDE